jgi:GAF domain-containing protein
VIGVAERADVPDEVLRMSQLINSPHDVDAQLKLLVQMARASMPEIDHAGISIAYRDGRVETKAATGDLVGELDELQYSLGEGPCLHAIKDEPVVKVEYAKHDQRWPKFIPNAVAYGLRSQLGVRLYVDEKERGGLNLYSTSSDTIEAESEHFAEVIASYAAQALGRVRVKEKMDNALSSSRTIGTAIGIVMERYRLDPDRAFIYLTRVASDSETKLRNVAAQLVEETTERTLAGSD